MSDSDFGAGSGTSLPALLMRGILGRCPRCGVGPLFRNFLTVRDSCPHCRLDMTEHDMGDGPAVAGTFIIGFIALAVAVWLQFTYEPPMWVQVVVSIPVVLGGTIGALRPIKGITIALQYKYRHVDRPTPPGGV